MALKAGPAPNLFWRFAAWAGSRPPAAFASLEAVSVRIVLLLSVILAGASIPWVPEVQAASYTIRATSAFTWSPSTLDILVGDTVTVVDDSSAQHTYEDVDTGEFCALPCTLTYDAPRTVDYRCSLHPWMTGTITVASLDVSVAIATPAVGASVAGNVTVSGTASHVSSAITSVVVGFAGGSSVAASLSGAPLDRTWTATLASTEHPDGVREIVATATNAAGRTGEARRSVGIANPVTVAFTSPALDASVAGLVRVTGSAAHPATDIDSVSVRFDGGAAVLATLAGPMTSPTWTADVDASLVADGSRALIAVATNAAGKSAEARRTVVIANPVLVTITSPSTGQTVGDIVRVTGTASHPSVGIQRVSVKFDAGAAVEAALQGTGTQRTWSVDLDSDLVADGPHTIVATATITSGRTGEARRDVIVSNPEIVDLNLTSLVGGDPAIGTRMPLQVTMRNDGNIPTGAVLVRAEYLYGGAWRPIGDATLASAAPGKTTTVEIVWAPQGLLVGRFEIRATLDPARSLPDVDLADNVRHAGVSWGTRLVPGTAALL